MTKILQILAVLGCGIASADKSCKDIAFEWFYNGPPNQARATADASAQSFCETYKDDPATAQDRLDCVAHAFEWHYHGTKDQVKAVALTSADTMCDYFSGRIEEMEKHEACFADVYEYFYHSQYDMIKSKAISTADDYCFGNNDDLALMQSNKKCWNLAYDFLYHGPHDLMKSKAIARSEVICKTVNAAVNVVENWKQCITEKFDYYYHTEDLMRSASIKKADEACADLLVAGVFFKVSGTVRNAVTGSVLSGATVAIEDVSSTTDDKGEFELEHVAEGTHTLSVTAAGCAVETREVEVHDNVLGLAFAASPHITENQWRYVLSWGRNPADLDIHIVMKSGGASCEVYYSKKTCNLAGFSAQLDVDARQGFGPETITVTRSEPTASATLEISVVHYAGSGTILSGGATVKAYHGDAEPSMWSAPADATGKIWTVGTEELAPAAVQEKAFLQ